MIPLVLLPGHVQWGAHLEELLARPEALWVYGPMGSGVSLLAAELAQRRQTPCLEVSELEATSAWLADHPRGVVAARVGAPGHLPCLSLRLPGLDEHPEAIPALLSALAEEEGLSGTLPSVLGTLPCPGNLRELRNRLLRWKLLGQLPAAEPQGPLAVEAEDLATNLHALERHLLHQALRRSYGNRVEAAQRLGVSRRQLYLLIRRHGDPVRGEAATGDLPQRVLKRRPEQNSSPDHQIR
ncbi:helix-turn-helix domain-containing protein [Geothrix sp. PMB-07]|uniref:helix-turn-helix domain-containing protein n=1 Tax=Geothrix sp. PMB-07 TaxID=3068640 RepID=UPI002740C296|nr:helix-turn-helix domain-containing protein [Geothrix sp. PMB-07]WLT32390.1 helix-turn-helix domain-containing protein [Geothrix sp. PMB-07]